MLRAITDQDVEDTLVFARASSPGLLIIRKRVSYSLENPEMYFSA